MLTDGCPTNFENFSVSPFSSAQQSSSFQLLFGPQYTYMDDIDVVWRQYFQSLWFGGQSSPQFETIHNSSTIISIKKAYESCTNYLHAVVSKDVVMYLRVREPMFTNSSKVQWSGSPRPGPKGDYVSWNYTNP